MFKRIAQACLALLVIGVVYLNVDYWQDPLYWRRWVDIFANPDPAHMNFDPVETVSGRGPFFLPLADDNARTISDDAIAKAIDYAASFDSFAFIAVHNGIVQAEWYNDGWGPDSLTQSQSMHKSIAALLVGIAMEKGFIASLEEPIGTYVTEWAQDPRGDITLRQLLVMSSGLESYDFTLNPFVKKQAFRFLNASDRASFLLSSELLREPGSRFEYNDVNAALVALIVERATGQRYADFLSAYVWQPMGGQGAEVWLDDDNGLAMSACCLLAPAMDWARLGLMIKDGGVVNGNRIVSSDYIENMITPSEQNSRYGLFTWLAGAWDQSAGIGGMEIGQTEPYVSDDVVMFLGRGGQRVYVSRAHDLVVVRLGPHSGIQPLKEGWDNAALMNMMIRGVKQNDDASSR